MRAKKIIINSRSGYRPAEYAYRDELKITVTTITYVCKPFMETGAAIEHKNWSYKTTNADFALTFEKIVDAVSEILKHEPKGLWCDCGSIEFTLVYEDGNKTSRSFECPSDEFEECFKIIRKIIPLTEDVPETLTVREDDCDENG